MIIKKIADRPAKFLINTNYRLTLYSSSLVRLEFSKKGLFDDENPLITDHPTPSFNEDVVCKIKQKTNSFVLSTDCFELNLFPDGNRFDIGNLYFTIKKNKYRWQPGIIDEQNLGSAMLDLYKFPEGKANEKFTEGLISKNGYFVFRNHCEFLWDPEKNWIKRKSDWESQDWYLFGYGTDYKKAFSDFVKLFGKIPLPPKWTFGYWYSKWYRFKDVEILDVIKKLKKKEIPIDVFVIDTDWRKNVWNGYEWNRELIPDYKKLLQELKSQNIHTCLNDHPGYGQSDELPPDDPYREKIKAKIPDITEYRIRWSDERYVFAWLDEIFTKFLHNGIDFWWVDGWGATNGIMDFSSQLWLNRWYFEAAKRTGDNRRPLILSRWGGIGSHKYPVQFSGDTHSSFETLKYQISFTHKGGNIGACYWSHDIGGFLGGKIADELFIRWLQFGCFSPVLRTHSSGAEREVWNYSKEVLKIFTKYVKIRYALFPYFYTLARECYDTGLPLIRGLYLEYPNDKNAYLSDDQYLIGNSILVAPAYGGGEGDAFERDVYFPKGTWISLEDKKIVKGPKKIKIKIPLDRIPIFIKSGSIIPTSPVKQNLSEKISELELSVYADTRNEFLYYEDDGLTEKYVETQNQYLTQKITVTKSKKETKIVLFAAVGNYQNCPAEICYKLNLFLNKGREGNPKAVYINGEKKEFKYTTKIFSETVNSPFKFLELNLGVRARNEKIEIIVR